MGRRDQTGKNQRQALIAANERVILALRAKILLRPIQDRGWGRE
jgi:hypothetical protein